MKAPKIILFIFGLPFFAVGVFTGYLAFKQIATYFEAQSWETVPATITSLNFSSHTETDADGKNHSYYIGAEYTYQVNGQTYQGHRVTFADNMGNDTRESKLRDELQPFLDAGRTHDAFVNPANPEQVVLMRNFEWAATGFMLVFVIMFGGVGLIMMLAAIYGGKKVEQETQTAMQFPDEPWRWKKEWQTGVIKAHMAAAAGFMWFFAIVWNAVSFPIAFFVLPEEIIKGNYVVLFVLLFPLVGLGLLIAAIKWTIRARKFRQVEFRMLSVPGVIGGKLAGSVYFTSSSRTTSDYVFSLSCTKTVRSGTDNDTTTHTLWQHIKKVPAISLGNAALSGIPVEFTIPSNCEATNENERIRWTLNACAEAPGVDFSADFEVPVFRTSASRDNITEEQVAEDSGPVEIPIEPNKEVKHQLLPTGELEIVIPSYGRRNPGAVVALFVFSSIFFGIGVGTWYGEAPIPVSLIFGGIGLLMYWGMFVMMFRRERLLVSSDRMKLTVKYLIRRKNYDWHKSEIAKVSVKTGAATQQGAKVSANYTTQLHLKGAESGKPQAIASDIGDKASAYWVADQVRKQLHLQAVEAEHDDAR